MAIPQDLNCNLAQALAPKLLDQAIQRQLWRHAKHFFHAVEQPRVLSDLLFQRREQFAKSLRLLLQVLEARRDDAPLDFDDLLDMT